MDIMQNCHLSFKKPDDTCGKAHPQETGNTRRWPQVAPEEFSHIPSKAWLPDLRKDMADSLAELLIEFVVEVAAEGHQCAVDARHLGCKGIFIVAARPHIGLGPVGAVGHHLQDLGPCAWFPHLQSGCRHEEHVPACQTRAAFTVNIELSACAVAREKARSSGQIMAE